ncbi:SURP and G-patch domain-containing protein 1 [Xenopus tropicalis]|uniref:Novel protein containing Surp module and G-patch domain n=1 Tax=Xenopus tropicalis TaxID=8364 RepID=Q28E21_XENTR|nr:SURP and G-patch domain-containing protein 1 [Xenopus tropicalis]CAJ81949.1 Novel protein containing Surp module and G-patch domain [Xenopus tropicalis]|eukprot:NP_001015943.1 SURP and G-patch domain-containing protein 1 [Xenopus tropicalis]
MERAKAPGVSARWFASTRPKPVKPSTYILYQEELIEKKKKEIAAKAQHQTKQPQPQPSVAPQDSDSQSASSSASNKFANDGSFLQQFLKLQKDKSSNENLSSSSGSSGTSQKKPILIGKRHGHIESMLNQMKNYSHTKQTPTLNRLSVFKSPEEDDDDEEDYEQWLEIKVSPPEDSEIRKVVEKLARFVAEGGRELEKMAKEDYKDNPAFGFLHDTNSREFLYYRRKLAEYKKESKDPQKEAANNDDEESKMFAEKLARFVADGGPEVEAIALQNNRENPAFRFLYDQNSRGFKWYKLKLEEYRQAKHHSTDPPSATNFKHKLTPETSNSALPSTSLQTPTVSDIVNTEQTAMKRKRKSRWGPEDDKVDMPPANVSTDPPDTSLLTAQDLKGLGYDKGKPVGLVGVTELSEAQKKQLKEQQEMQQMYNMIMTHKRAMQEVQLMWEKAIKQHQHEYDSDEEVDNEFGTWEHQLRRMEMDKTREWAEELTEMGRGKHFIGDFLPPDELEKFMETFKALKEGREPDYSEYKEFKLTVENLGYQMLMKMGWKEGEGLGTEGQGIKNPVNKGTTAVDGAGFGIDRPAELNKGDDEYDAFRKRMMLAYRFRPNPLNNPRRPYY